MDGDESRNTAAANTIKLQRQEGGMAFFDSVTFMFEDWHSTQLSSGDRVRESFWVVNGTILGCHDVVACRC